jgi:hypothetical protein
MLIRIEPDMLTDSRYGCVTIRKVWEEFFQTQKFKSKYPWRRRDGAYSTVSGAGWYLSHLEPAAPIVELDQV